MYEKFVRIFSPVTFKQCFFDGAKNIKHMVIRFSESSNVDIALKHNTGIHSVYCSNFWRCIRLNLRLWLQTSQQPFSVIDEGYEQGWFANVGFKDE